MTGADREYIRLLLAQWETFAMTRGDTPEAKTSRGEGHARAAELQSILGEFPEAENQLRVYLTIREKSQPDAWPTFNTQSLLGGALLGQEKYAEAEPLLLKGYEGLKVHAKAIPPEARARIPEAIERLVKLCEATDRKEDADRWRKELDAVRATQKEVEKSP